MHVLISDLGDLMLDDYAPYLASLKAELPDATIDILPYGSQAFYESLALADGLLSAFIPITKELLTQAPRLKVISIMATGYSTCDVRAIEHRGILLSHVREYCTREVSEHAIALMIALVHQLKIYDHVVGHCIWEYQGVQPSYSLDEMTIAVFGIGRIGKMTGKLAQGLGMHVLGIDPYCSQEEMAALGIEKCDKQEALCQCDVVICHMALNNQNYHYFDQEAFKQMKKRPYFINVSRGGCVDEKALIKALDDHQIAGAGLDVLEQENPDLRGHSLLLRNNVILTPHCGFYSIHSLERLAMISSQNLSYGLKGDYQNIDEIVKEER